MLLILVSFLQNRNVLLKCDSRNHRNLSHFQTFSNLKPSVQITPIGDGHSQLPKCPSYCSLWRRYCKTYYSFKNITDLKHHINPDLGSVSEWFSRNLLTLNIAKCIFFNLLKSTETEPYPRYFAVKLEGTRIERTQSSKYLGVRLR